ncbi:MAG: hypothetical protein OEZ54_12795, partial [Gemmatimonadota bacterium]|nr:hypothetical protein [Gemmatimonadota bacterium]
RRRARIETQAAGARGDAFSSGGGRLGSWGAIRPERMPIDCNRHEAGSGLSRRESRRRATFLGMGGGAVLGSGRAGPNRP